MTLEEMLEVVNDSTEMDIVDADTGEVYAYGEKDDLSWNSFNAFGPDSYMVCEVMDVNVYGNRLTICIDAGNDDWDDDAEEDLFNDPDTVDGWIQQDAIDMYRRER